MIENVGKNKLEEKSNADKLGERYGLTVHKDQTSAKI